MDALVEGLVEIGLRWFLSTESEDDELVVRLSQKGRREDAWSSVIKQETVDDTTYAKQLM